MEDSAGLAGDALSRDVLGDIGCLWEKYHYSDSDICFRMAGFDLSNIVKNYQLKNFPLHRVLVVTLHIENFTWRLITHLKESFGSHSRL